MQNIQPAGRECRHFALLLVFLAALSGTASWSCYLELQMVQRALAQYRDRHPIEKHREKLVVLVIFLPRASPTREGFRRPS